MTWQIRDTIEFNGLIYDLNEYLLDKYFIKFKKQRPEMTVADSACWRGHIVNFEIRDEYLIIKNIDFLSQNGKAEGEKFINKYFSNRKFEWFSGLLRIDNFKGDYDDEFNENSIFEYLEIKKGKLINYWKFNYNEFQEFKSVLFSEFKKLKEYDAIFSDFKKANLKIKYSEIDNKIQQNIIFIINENYSKIG
ncbi:hypothetical protein [Empedobacter tilapiae]